MTDSSDITPCPGPPECTIAYIHYHVGPWTRPGSGEGSDDES